MVSNAAFFFVCTRAHICTQTRTSGVLKFQKINKSRDLGIVCRFSRLSVGLDDTLDAVEGCPGVPLQAH